MKFSLKDLSVKEHEQIDELMESVKDGNLSADEHEEKVKELGKILHNHEEDYFTDLIIDYKEAYNRWQNKQGAPTSYFYEQVGMELDYLENCLVGVERAIEEESKLDPNYDRSTDNPIISEMFHIDNAIRYLQSIESELKNAMGQQVQNAGSQISDSLPPQAPETMDIPATPIERIANAVEQIKEKIIIKPNYIDSLIQDNLIYPDGIRVVKSLEEVAIALSKEFPDGHPVSADFLKQTFRKSDGEPFSKSACRKAAETANAL